MYSIQRAIIPFHTLDKLNDLLHLSRTFSSPCASFSLNSLVCTIHKYFAHYFLALLNKKHKFTVYSLRIIKKIHQSPFYPCQFLQTTNCNTFRAIKLDVPIYPSKYSCKERGKNNDNRTQPQWNHGKVCKYKESTL